MKSEFAFKSMLNCCYWMLLLVAFHVSRRW